MERMPMHGLIHDDGWFCFSVFALLPTLLFRFSSLFFFSNPRLPYAYIPHLMYIFETTYTQQQEQEQHQQRRGEKFKKTIDNRANLCTGERERMEIKGFIYTCIYKQTITCNYYYLPIYTEGFCNILSVLLVRTHVYLIFELQIASLTTTLLPLPPRR